MFFARPTEPAHPSKQEHSVDKQWYYKKRDARIGPIAEEELIKLFRSREIGRSTLVSGRQNDQSQPEWRLFWASGILSREELTPPPLRSSFASDRYVWLIAVFPLLLSIGDLIRTVLVKGATYEPGIVLVSLLCYGLLAWLDQNKLLALGYTDAEDRLSVWWALLIPVYLWKRAISGRQYAAADRPSLRWMPLGELRHQHENRDRVERRLRELSWRGRRSHRKSDAGHHRQSGAA
jgi:GYF domain 2